MKDELGELLELLIDIVVTPSKTDQMKEKITCTPHSLTFDSEVMSNSRQVSRAMSDVTGRQRSRKTQL